MKYIFLNLKRFDVPVELGGVNRLAPVTEWAKAIVEGTQEGLKKIRPRQGGVRAVLPRGPYPERRGGPV